MKHLEEYLDIIMIYDDMIMFFVRSGEMNCDFPDGHGFSFLPCFFLIRVGMIRFIQMDPTQKNNTQCGELEIFHQRKKPQEKTWKNYHKTSEGTLFPGVFEGKFFFQIFS